MRRLAVLFTIAALALAALPAVASAEPPSYHRLTGWGSSSWTGGWYSPQFASSRGAIDVWYRFQPISNATRCRVGVRIVPYDDDYWEKMYRVPCDRRGHWLRNVGVPPGTWLQLVADTYPSDGSITGWTSAYGWGIP
jgi:hypothetical protein